MSTILDALRKVEEANRMKNTDVRTRLLTGSSRFDLRPLRSRRLSWALVTGLILVGVAVGSGVRGWKGQQQTGAETPATSPVLTSQPSPRIAATPFYPDPASGTPPRPIPSVPSPPPPAKVEEPPISSAPVPAEIAQVAPADRPPPRIAETPFYPDPASGIPPRPIPPVPNVAQGEGASVPETSLGSRNPLSQAQAAYPNFPGVGLLDGEGKAIQDRLSMNPVQRSPFMSTPEPERVVPATPKPTPTAPSPATKEAKTAKVAPVQPTPAPLEDSPIAEMTPPSTSASLSFLQWSPEPEKRIAFIKIGDGPTTLAHEGDTVNGVTIVKIRKDAVDLQSGDSRWTLRTQ